MYDDDLKRRLHDELDTAIGTRPSLDHSKVLERGRHKQQKRWLVTTTSVVAVGVTLLTVGPTIGKMFPGPADKGATPIQTITDSELPPPPASPPEDQVAAEVIEALRANASLCRGYDFQFKGEIEGQPYRPVQCDAQTRLADLAESPSPTPGTPPSIEYIAGPKLVIYAFADPETRATWVETVQAPLGGRLVGDDWVIDVMDRTAYREIESQVPGQKEAISPRDAWSFEGHLLEAEAGGKGSRVSLDEAVSTARNNEEVLLVELITYTNEAEDIEGLRAWHIVLRRCVPPYGGIHAESGCEGLQSHVIIHARNRAVVARFTT